MEVGPVDMGGRRNRLSGTDFDDSTIPLVYSDRDIVCDHFLSMIVVLEATVPCQLAPTQREMFQGDS